MQDSVNSFTEEAIKRSVLECTDVKELRKLTLQALELLENQRKVFETVIRWPGG